jgi:molecular chaperone HtpG
MNETTAGETRGFEAEVQQLLDLMIHSLYGNREIFLRELISNASDAADKLRFEALQDDALFENDPDLRIRIEYSREQRTITVTDNGIGMSRDEAIAHLGTIAKSGTREFFRSLTGDQARDTKLIGQFGVGFYSAFMVAEKIEVDSRRAGLSRGEGVRWTSSGRGEYTVETIDRPRRGTRVTLTLRAGEEEFLDGGRLRTIIRRYSDHISLPIVMPGEGEGAGDVTVNAATALWTRPKKEITGDEYREFYRHVAHDFGEPLAWVHSRVEGTLEYTSLLFIPSRAPFDLWDRERRRGVRLYVRRIFILDDAEQLLPPWLRFVRGVVDCDDLPLNVSREILQQNRTIDAIRGGCTKRVLELLESMAANEPEKYATFWSEFGRVLKEGIVDAPERQADIAKLLRFASTAAAAGVQTVSLADYLQRIPADQKAIYYLTAGSDATARSSPHLEIFRERDLEVLLLTDPVDEWLAMHLTEYEGKPLQPVTRADVDPGEIAGGSAELPASAQGRDELLERLREALGEHISEVRASRRLTASPACLVAGEHDISRHLQAILEAAGQNVPAGRPILEVNIAHPLVARLALESDTDRFRNWAEILYDQAVLAEGGRLADPADFVRRLNSLLMELPGLRPKEDNMQPGSTRKP